ncbi:MAG: DUF4956 domain-containing protein [Microgenomates group bacterium]
MNNLAKALAIIPIEVPLALVVANILLSAFFSLILGWFFVRFGQSLSNRSRLARNFVIVAVTTALVITIIKSSLALSLGLVGALSIVRFRAAIKEPEELGFLFLAIALGLGFGANQTAITIVSFLTILAVLFLLHLFRLPQKKENLYLTIKLNKKKKFDLAELMEMLKENLVSLDLRRVEETKSELHLGCLVELNDPQQLKQFLANLRKKYPEAHLLMVDSSGIAR